MKNSTPRPVEIFRVTVKIGHAVHIFFVRKTVTLEYKILFMTRKNYKFKNSGRLYIQLEYCSFSICSVVM